MHKFIYLLAFFILTSCNDETPLGISEEFLEEETTCDRLRIDSSKVIVQENRLILRAGNENEVFDITDSNLDLCKLRQGLGREFFPALYEPTYDPLDSFFYADDMQCILLRDKGVIRIYPYSVLAGHEAVNEFVGDEPVMIVYCILADLAAVYTRNYCGNVFTFAPSGYTYTDSDYWDGVEGFILWDRETESLWWPLNDKGMSGLMKDVELKKASTRIWETTTWGEIKKNYPKAVSLSHTQDIEIPSDLGQYDSSNLQCN
jgi:hypothetical protein